MKTYFTFLNRNKLFTFVNVVGLSVSLMFVLLIADMVGRQLTVDKDLPDADRISVLANEHWAGGHYNLGDRLQSRYPEIEDWCAYTSGEMLVAHENKTMQMMGAIVRKNFFSFFQFPLLEGSRSQLLTDNYSIVLARSAARRLFGTEHAIGRTLKIDKIDDGIFTVAGIMEDIDNSVIPSEIDFVIPYENMKYFNEGCAIEDSFMSNAAGAMIFVRTASGADLNAKSSDVVAYLKEFFWIYQKGDGFNEAHFIPLHDFYFSDIPATNDLNQYDFNLVMIFLAVGVLILLMAVSNYISMSVAQTGSRAKEMATRRLLGSSRPDIFWRMMLESFFLTAVSFAVGFLLALAAEPVAMELLNVTIDLAGDFNAAIAVAYALFLVILSLLAGFVPATVLSGYNPIDVVKGTFRRKTKSVYLRVLSVVQCGLTIALLTCSVYLSVQLYRILHTPLGYEYGNVLTYPPVGDKQSMQLFRTEANKLPFVKRVSFSNGLPCNGGNNNTKYIPLADSTLCLSFQTFIVDSAFLDIYHIRITEDRHLPMADENYFMSQHAMKLLEPTGSKDYFVDEWGKRTQIVGVFEDFLIRRTLVDKDIHPLRIQVRPADEIYPWDISVEVQGSELEKYKKELDALYAQVNKDIPFDSQWYGDRMKDLYDDFGRMNSLMLIFTGAALLISLLGLIAMNLYFIVQRKRDIAIRKVFGSTASGEQIRLMRFSFTSIGFSLLMAVPLMIFGISQIDSIVTFESSFPWWVPLLSVAFIAFISLISVYLIGMKAMRENPVNNLKTE